MRGYKHTSTILGTTAVCCLCLLLILTVGCGKKETEKPASPAKGTAEFANVSCPIMGNPLDLANVPENLVRTYKGKKVAFCCGACPTTWDGLSDTEKDAKLAKVASK